ncbi:MAG: hypothetical protein H0Z38_00625 [Firmicutes bacterium]|nr:hypothetical protein [Bacillota bacterium]
MADLAIRYDDRKEPDAEKKDSVATGEEDVKIIWKGKKIAKVVFSSGKEVVFEE